VRELKILTDDTQGEHVKDKKPRTNQAYNPHGPVAATLVRQQHVASPPIQHQACGVWQHCDLEQPEGSPVASRGADRGTAVDVRETQLT